MRIQCPRGWKRVMRFGNITWEDSTVRIYDGICDSPDRCGIESCEFYDTSREATRRFHQALLRSQTLEGLWEKQDLREMGLC